MTLDEAIQHCLERQNGDDSCSLEHRQLAEWLTELRERRRSNETEALEEEIQHYVENTLPCGFFVPPIARHFAQWQKEQILKRAFTAELARPKKKGQVHLCGNFACGNSGEKVKIVIIKEE